MTPLAAKLRLATAVLALAVAVSVGGCAGNGESPNQAAEPESRGTEADAGTSIDPSYRDAGLCPEKPWMAPDLSAAQRTAALIDTLTIEQKVAQTHGDPRPEDFRIVPGIEDLCIPDLTVTNGPAGVGASIKPLEGVPATAMPAPIAVASTFDREMSRQFGDLVGKEMVLTGRNLLESPDVDLARVPYNGRTFEAFGEDPYLVSETAVAQIEAVQRHGVIAMVKHYVANNQETDRATVDAVVGERALHELYLAPFEAAVVDADVASVMCAYNRTNGAYNCGNEPLLTGVLRDQWGFEGFVQSDFGATHAVTTLDAVHAGMDLEMPGANIYGQPLLDAVNAGTVSEEDLDGLLQSRYLQMFRLGLFDHPSSTGDIPIEEHAKVARRIGAAGTVLLRNEGGVLPLDDSSAGSVAVVGAWATRAATGGGGSSIVNPIRTVTPVEGISERAGEGVEVILPDDESLESALRAAESADVAVVVVGEQLSEGTDRSSLTLPDGQDEFIEAVAAVNSNTVVVLHVGAPVLMPWLSNVSAVVLGWYPGQEDGATTANILFGDAEPNGRLPITFPAADADIPTDTAVSFPGVDDVVRHEEDLEVGYRHYLANDVEPLFPFGFGLSYTTFSLSDLEAPADTAADEPLTIEVTVENTGDRAGSEVVQVYVESPAEVGAPSMQLQGFTKVILDAGESKTVDVELSERAFSHWDEKADGWAVTPGTYRILVGPSSADAPLTAEVEVG